VLRAMPEMLILREKILNEIVNTGGGLEEQELRGVFEDHHKNISVEGVAVMTTYFPVNEFVDVSQRCLFGIFRLIFSRCFLQAQPGSNTK
jgi:hypothetical protein